MIRCFLRLAGPVKLLSGPRLYLLQHLLHLLFGQPAGINRLPLPSLLGGQRGVDDTLGIEAFSLRDPRESLPIPEGGALTSSSLNPVTSAVAPIREWPYRIVPNGPQRPKMPPPGSLSIRNRDHPFSGCSGPYAWIVLTPTVPNASTRIQPASQRPERQLRPRTPVGTVIIVLELDGADQEGPNSRSSTPLQNIMVPRKRRSRVKIV